MHVAYRPFREPALNFLQSVSLGATSVMFLSGLLVNKFILSQPDGLIQFQVGSHLLEVVSLTSALVVVAPFVLGGLLVYDKISLRTWRRAMLYLSCEKVTEEESELDAPKPMSVKVRSWFHVVLGHYSGVTFCFGPVHMVCVCVCVYVCVCSNAVVVVAVFVLCLAHGY
jgi:hypothetical protein